MKVLNCAQSIKIEETQVAWGTTLATLMLNAGRAAGRYMFESINLASESNIVILCGKGNNGGDGFILAEFLLDKGLTPTVVLVDGEVKAGAASMAYHRLTQKWIKVWRYSEDKERVAEKIEDAEYVVDAIFGIGFSGGLDDSLRELVAFVNQSSAKVISLDLPSGAQCDTGAIENECMKADVTIAFSTLKPAHIFYPSIDFCGKTVVAQIGIEDEIIEASECVTETIDAEEIKNVLPENNISDHKGSFGTLFALCGSYGMAGAAHMCISAALRSGVGIVIAGVIDSIYPTIATNIPQAVYLPLSESQGFDVSLSNMDSLTNAVDNSSAMLVGCGFGISQNKENILVRLLKHSKNPMVIDADGINMICKHINELRAAKCPVVLTPHPGEMARLMDTTTEEIQRNRIEYAKKLAIDTKTIVVLKGAKTVVASPDGRTLVCLRGSNSMAKGGSGDVLAGMIGAFLAQGADPYLAAAACVYIHACAGERAGNKIGRISVQPTDIINELPLFYREIME